MADISKLKHLLDLQDPSEKFNMTAPENLTEPQDESTPENDPTAFTPAEEGSDEEESPAQSNPGPLASAADIAKIQSIPLPDAQKSIRAPATTPEAQPLAPTASNPAEDAMSAQRKKYEDLLTSLGALKPAQEKYKNDLGNLAVLQGGNQIAQAMAARYGGKIGDGSDAIKALKEQAQRPVQEIEENMKMGQEGIKSESLLKEFQRLQQASDKTSDVSKFAREQAVNQMLRSTGEKDPAAKEKLLKQFESMSALDLEKMGFKISGLNPHVASKAEKILINGHPATYDPNTAKYVDAITGKVAGPEDVITSSVARKDAMDETYKYTPTNGAIMGAPPAPGKPGAIPNQVSPADATNPVPSQSPATPDAKSNFIPTVPQRKALDKKEVEFDAAIKDHAQRLRDANALLQELESDNKLQIPAVRERIARIAKGAGVLSQYDEQAFGGSSALLDRLAQWVQTHTESTFTPDNKKEFKDLMHTYVQTAQQAIPDAQEKFAQRMEMGYGVPPEFTKKYLGGMPTTPNLDKEAAKSDVVTVKGPSGQTVQMKKDVFESKYKSKPGYSIVQ